MNELSNKIIDELGGTCAVAKFCSIKPPSVSAWRTKGIPRPWLMLFQKMHPDLFPKDKSGVKSITPKKQK